MLFLNAKNAAMLSKKPCSVSIFQPKQSVGLGRFVH